MILAGIVGIARTGESDKLIEALGLIYHRGTGPAEILECAEATLGQLPSAVQPGHGNSADGVVLDGSIYNWEEVSPEADSPQQALRMAYDKKGPGFVESLDGPFAIAMTVPEGVLLARDAMGITPLYYGLHDGATCFASEVKALIELTSDVSEFPPGYYAVKGREPVPYASMTPQRPLSISAEEIADELRSRLEASVQKRISGCDAGCWLSGGLDSSVMSAFASRDIPRMKTFAVGMDGAPDLEHARAVAEFLGTDHHELICTVDDLARALPDVIYHLESFDALLVRSSLTNFLVGKLSSEHVDVVLSGEGGDELFAGYDYLKSVEPSDLPEELVDITSRLHNTALQRVDRCSSAHGLVARMGFLDKDVVDYALRIPTDYKIHANGRSVEKWILRRAVDGMLPDEVVERPKVKFWEGAGVTDLLAERAEELVSDSDYRNEQQLADGSILRSKEELLYYRIFRECFSSIQDLSFVGRTKEVSS
jgi:asparagine synthase (glutamine-hydrolysing)